MNPAAPGPLIARGRTAEVFAWEGNQVLKLFYARYPPDLARREAEVGHTIAALTLPTPRLIATVEIDHRPGIIYERVDGPSMLSICGAKPWLVFRLARQLAELHSEIHRQDGRGLPDMRASLKATIQHGENLPPDLKTAVLQLLERLPDGGTLCHGDFHPDQVLLTARGPQVIDWMTAHQGSPLADVAKTCILLSIGQVPYGNWAMRTMINLWRGLFYQTYFSRYLELHPEISRDAVRTWMVPVAAARLSEGIAGEQAPLLKVIQENLLKTTNVANAPH